MRVIMRFRLRTAADCRLTAPAPLEIKGNRTHAQGYVSKEAKAAGKVEKAATWPKFWTARNKRLKAA